MADAKVIPPVDTEKEKLIDEKLELSRQTELQKKNFVVGKYVCFTSYDLLTEPIWDEKIMDYLIFQKEICPDTGRQHYQGYVEFKKTARLHSIWESLGKKGCHVETRKAKDGKKAADYCRKPETAVPGSQKEFGKLQGSGQGFRTDLEKPTKMLLAGKSLKELAMEHPVAFIKHSRGFQELQRILRPEIKIPKPEIKLRPWQERIISEIDSMSTVDRRKGIWIWSRASGTGKSTTIKYLMWKYGTENIIPGVFKWDDFLYAYNKQKVITFNIPRGYTLNDTHYAVLEKSTDGGVVLSGKYQSETKFIDAIVLVFANCKPPHERLPDRFIEICLDPIAGPDPVQDQ